MTPVTANHTMDRPDVIKWLNEEVVRKTNDAFATQKVNPEHTAARSVTTEVYQNRSQTIVYLLVLYSIIAVFWAPYKALMFWLVVMYFYMDFYGGLLHFVLDDPKNLTLPLIGQGCLEFQWHHNIPNDISSKPFVEVLGDLNMVAILSIAASMVCGYFAHQNYLIITVLFPVKYFWAAVGQYSHRATHVVANKRPAWVVFLQDWGILLHPTAHRKHHSEYDQSYPILSGHTSFMHDRLFTSLPSRLLWLGIFLALTVFDVTIMAVAAKLFY